MTQIRRFENRDAESVKELVLQIMDSEFRDEKSAFSFEDLDHLKESYGSLGEAFFVAEAGKKLVGTIGVKREDERVALLQRIFVSPEYRNKKVGLRLLNRAIEFCGEVGYRDLVFKTTSRMTGAIDLFKKRGFQTRGKVSLGKLELIKLTFRLAPSLHRSRN